MNTMGENGSRREDELAASVGAIAAAIESARLSEAKERRRGRLWGWIWRGFFVAIIVLAAIGSSVSDPAVLGDQIARYSVDGVITDDPERDALLKKIAEEDKVKALIVRINSPGGTTTGGEALYESLRDVAEKKPVVAVMGEVAASAGYMSALAADRLYARGNTITASIGVIFTAPNFHQLLDNVGVGVVELKSGLRKAEPSPYKPVDPATLTVERELIEDSFDWFIGLVKERRSLTEATVREISDGRVLTGRMAAEAGLIDEIGGEEAAIAWLESEKGVAADLSVIDRKVEEPEPGLLEILFGQSAGADLLTIGGAALGERLQRIVGGPALMSVVE